MRRRTARRTGRRVARRTTRRTMVRGGRVRRRRRRRIMVGGMVLLAVGGAVGGAIKLSQQDAQRVEQYTGASVEELSEEELVAAMEGLGIQSIELDENDQAIITEQTGSGAAASAAAAPASAAQPEPSYLEELERLASLRDQGVLSDEEFEAKKNQLLGL